MKKRTGKAIAAANRLGLPLPSTRKVKNELDKNDPKNFDSPFVYPKSGRRNKE